MPQAENGSLAKKDSLLVALSSAKDENAKVNAVLGLCDHLLMRAAPDQVWPYAEKADSIINRQLTKTRAGQSEIKKNKARVLCIKGSLRLKTGDFEQAIKFQNQALEIYREQKFQKGIATVYYNLGFIHTKKAEYAKALEYQLKSLQIREKLRDSSDMAFCYYNMGMLYHLTGNETLALKMSFNALRIRERMGNQYDVTSSLVGLGNIYYGNKNILKALEFYKKAYEVNKKLDHPEIEAALFLNIGNIFYERDQLDSASLYYAKAMKLFEKRRDGINYAKAAINLSGIYYASQNYKQAKDIILQNIDSIKRYHANASLEDVYERLIKCDSALGNIKGAFAYSRLQTRIAKKNEADKAIAQLSELQIKFDLQKKEDENRALASQNQIQTLHLHRSRLFMLLTGLLLVFSALVFYFIFRRYKYKSETEAIRLQQKLLRVQMNPHFIFNCLQAIQNYIRKNEPRESAAYLNAFASLTRDVLENSRSEVIPLEKELNLLKNYLDLQKLRFEERFDYGIHLQEGLHTSSILLPPMLSQPFIENSIEHGFNDFESGGRVDIYFSLHKNALLMDIVDNGRGMETKIEKGDHSSLAIEITKERIHLLNKKKSGKSSFQITAANPASEQMKGVKVSFVIELE